MTTAQLAILLAFAGMASAAHANLLSNGSFENSTNVAPTDVGEGVSAYFFPLASPDLTGWAVKYTPPPPSPAGRSPVPATCGSI